MTRTAVAFTTEPEVVPWTMTLSPVFNADRPLSEPPLLAYVVAALTSTVWLEPLRELIVNELDPIVVMEPNAPGKPPRPPAPSRPKPAVTRVAVIPDDADPVPYTATTVPFFSEDKPVMPVPEKAVELVTLTAATVPARVVTVKLEAPIVATVPLTCGGVKPVGRVPAEGTDELGVVDPGEAAAGDEFEERLAVTRPATTPTATTRTATTNHVVRRLRGSSGVATSFGRSVMSCPRLPWSGRSCSQAFL